MLFGRAPDPDAARLSAVAEAERVCGLHGKGAQAISASCLDFRENIGMFKSACALHNFLFACIEN